MGHLNPMCESRSGELIWDSSCLCFHSLTLCSALVFRPYFLHSNSDLQASKGNFPFFKKWFIYFSLEDNCFIVLHFCCKGHFLQRITWLYWLRMRRGIQFAQPSCLQFCSSLSAWSAWPVRVSCGSWLTSHWYPPDRHLTSSFLACQTYNCFSSIVEMFLTFFLSWCIHFLCLYWHMFWERKKTEGLGGYLPCFIRCPIWLLTFSFYLAIVWVFSCPP